MAFVAWFIRGLIRRPASAALFLWLARLILPGEALTAHVLVAVVPYAILVQGRSERRPRKPTESAERECPCTGRAQRPSKECESSKTQDRTSSPSASKRCRLGFPKYEGPRRPLNHTCHEFRRQWVSARKARLPRWTNVLRGVQIGVR